MNSNFAQDDQGRLLAVLDDANVTLNVKTDGNTVASEIAHPIADLGGQDAVVVAVANTATVNVQDTVDVEVQNWPPDPASGTNQLAIIGKLPNPIAGKIPVDASGNVVPVSQSGSWAVFVNNVSLPLPTGAATETTLASLLALTGTSLGPWVDHDPVTVAAEPSSATQLPNYACSELKIIADRGNTQPIYFGGAGVDSTKSQDLNAREIEIVTRITNANQFYVVAAEGHTGQKVRIQTR